MLTVMESLYLNLDVRTSQKAFLFPLLAREVSLITKRPWGDFKAKGRKKNIFQCMAAVGLNATCALPDRIHP